MRLTSAICRPAALCLVLLQFSASFATINSQVIEIVININHGWAGGSHPPKLHGVVCFLPHMTHQRTRNREGNRGCECGAFMSWYSMQDGRQSYLHHEA